MSEQTTERKIDRSKWPAGPWDGEPDRVEWRTAAGLPALITRTTLGHLCGYVAVPPGHRAYGTTDDWDGLASSLHVHGGVTYGAKCSGHICHVPEPGEPDDVWWIGFDMAHSGDLCPYMLEHGGGYGGAFGDRYRTVDYVREQCEQLAAQLAGMVAT